MNAAAILIAHSKWRSRGGPARLRPCVEAEGKDEKKAQAAAKAALGKEFKAVFTPDNNEKRLKATAKKLDGSTGHGPTLKYTISK